MPGSPPEPLLPTPIAIDGPAASGKSSVGEALARRHGYAFLDTGLMYRAFALAAVRSGVSAGDEDACGALARALRMQVETEGHTRVFLEGEDVTGELRTPPVEDSVSDYSRIEAVRAVMVERQRAIAARGPVVLAGRDIGSVVLPTAPLKFYLDADEAERAARRLRQTGSDAEGPGENVSRRDRSDSTRPVAPLRRPADAIVIDTTAMALDDVIANVLAAVEQWQRPGPVPGAEERVRPLTGPQPKRPALRARAATAVRAGGSRLAEGLRGPLAGMTGRLRPRLQFESATRPFYWFCVHGLRMVLWVVGRWKATGREHVPSQGGFIVVSNHLNNADPPILGSGIARRRVRFMAKVELFKMPFGVIVKLYGAFPVRRFESDLRAMMNAERILRQGGVVGMFPEGTRSRTRTLGEFHPGTAVIALRSGAPVLPCALVGTEQLGNPFNVLRKPRIQVRIGEPIPVERVKRPSEAQVSELTQRMREAVAALLPPQYLASYTERDGGNPPGQ